MRKLGRISGVAVAATMAIAGSATGASAAVAAPSVFLDCESGLSRYLCTAVLSGGAPTSIRWYQSGIHLPAQDGRRAITGSCTSSTTIHVVAANAGGSDQSNTWRACRTGPWL